MFSTNFVVSILNDSGKVVNDVDGVVKVDAGTNYCVRIRNKHRLPCQCEVIVDGISVTGLDKIVLMGADFLDILGIIQTGERFKTAKGKHTIEANFFMQKEVNQDGHGISRRPLFLQKKEGDALRTTWQPMSWFTSLKSGDQMVKGSRSVDVLTSDGNVSADSMLDETSNVGGLIEMGAVASPDDLFSPESNGLHNVKFEKEAVQLKLTIKSK